MPQRSSVIGTCACAYGRSANYVHESLFSFFGEPWTFLESLGHFLESRGHFLESLGHVLESLGHVLESLGHFLESLGHFLESREHLLESLGHFLESLGGFKPANRAHLFFPGMKKEFYCKNCTQSTYRYMYEEDALYRKNAGNIQEV